MRSYNASIALVVLVALSNAVAITLMRLGGIRSLGEEFSLHNLVPWASASKLWLAGIALGWLSGLGWAWCLRRIPVTLGLPLYIGIAYACAVAGGALVLKERVSALQAAGIVTVLVGVVLLFLSVNAGVER